MISASAKRGRVMQSKGNGFLHGYDQVRNMYFEDVSHSQHNTSICIAICVGHDVFSFIITSRLYCERPQDSCNVNKQRVIRDMPGENVNIVVAHGWIDPTWQDKFDGQNRMSLKPQAKSITYKEQKTRSLPCPSSFMSPISGLILPSLSRCRDGLNSCASAP